MTFTQWFLFILVVQVVHFLGTWRLYKKAGKAAWKAAVPIYNAIVLMQLINRPRWWCFLLFIPVINLLLFPVIWVETCRSFGRNSYLDTWLAVCTLGLYIYYLNYFGDLSYIENRSLKPKTALGDWIGSIVFAVIVATLVHTYTIQPYTIPTSSLEKTLLVGDYLFVSKLHFGARIPMTVVAVPMVHDSIPFTKRRSFFNWPQLPYLRFPGFQRIKRNEIIVFNWPADTLKSMWGDTSGEFTYKPIDKKTNYVKRCVGIAGDSLEIRNGVIYINGKLSKMPGRGKPQFYYTVDTQGKPLSPRSIYNRYHVRRGEWTRDRQGKYLLNLDRKNAQKLKDNPFVKSITKNIIPKGYYNKAIFPHHVNYAWSQDNYGPIYIPKKGKTITLSVKTIPLYKDIIKRHEGNELVVNGKDIYINGKQATSYTFKQNYYWMMGDNRHNSLDARYWGFVPFDHIVGKPVFIWFSWDVYGKTFFKKIRWERLFTTVHGDKTPRSYFFYFVGILFLYVAYNSYRKKRLS